MTISVRRQSFELVIGLSEAAVNRRGRCVIGGAQ
jgi:hypothetical protein